MTPIFSIGRLRAAIVIALMIGGWPFARASDSAPCPPVERPDHCLLLAPKDRSRKTRDALRRVAAADGVRLDREGDYLSAYLSDERIAALFGARVIYRRVPASASNTGHAAVCAA